MCRFGVNAFFPLRKINVGNAFDSQKGKSCFCGKRALFVYGEFYVEFFVL